MTSSPCQQLEFFLRIFSDRNSTDQYTCRTFNDVNSLNGYIVFALVGLKSCMLIFVSLSNCCVWLSKSVLSIDSNLAGRFMQIRSSMISLVGELVQC